MNKDLTEYKPEINKTRGVIEVEKLWKTVFQAKLLPDQNILNNIYIIMDKYKFSDVREVFLKARRLYSNPYDVKKKSAGYVLDPRNFASILSTSIPVGYQTKSGDGYRYTELLSELPEYQLWYILENYCPKKPEVQNFEYTEDKQSLLFEIKMRISKYCKDAVSLPDKRVIVLGLGVYLKE